MPLNYTIYNASTNLTGIFGFLVEIETKAKIPFTEMMLLALGLIAFALTYHVQEDLTDSVFVGSLTTFLVGLFIYSSNTLNSDFLIASMVLAALSLMAVIIKK